jgi:hypothetical protein
VKIGVRGHRRDELMITTMTHDLPTAAAPFDLLADLARAYRTHEVVDV